jgi:hypothetical protein
MKHYRIRPVNLNNPEGYYVLQERFFFIWFDMDIGTEEQMQDKMDELIYDDAVKMGILE